MPDATREQRTAPDPARGATGPGTGVPTDGQVEDAAVEARQLADELEQQAEDLLAAAAHDDLLSGEVRERVAGVDESNPFGRRGRPLGRTSTLRTGFGLALGALLAYELGQAVLAVRQVLVLVLVSAFLAIGLDPAVTFLQQRMRRGVAVGLVMLTVLALLGGFIAAAVPPLSKQVSDLIAAAPGYVQDLRTNPQIQDLDRRFGILQNLEQQAGRLPDIGVQAVGGLIGVGRAVLGALASLLTVVILTLYFLTNLADIKRLFYLMVPRSRRARVTLLSDEILSRVGRYVLGQTGVALIAGVCALVFLAVAGIPYPIALALVVTLTDVIPLVGATIGAIIITLVAFLGAGTAEGIAAIVYAIAYQQFENYVVYPRVMKRAVDVSPVATILAALIGASLLGVVGAILAIPVAAGLQLIMREVVLPRQEET